MPKARKWPRELRKSITEEELAQRGAPSGLLLEMQETEAQTTKRLIGNYVTEVHSRAEIMLNFFGLSWPKNDGQWLSFLMKLCNYCEIPAFQIRKVPSRGVGATKRWTDEKNCELFADVNALVALRGMSEHSACQHIAKNPKRFKNRYNVKPKSRRKAPNDGRTLHRQYERVKRQIQTDAFFRHYYFGLPFGAVFSPTPVDYGPNLINVAISLYAVAQESAPGNVA